jgi:hypothetical protein
MEGAFFLADIVCMLVLGFAIFRAERKPGSEDLGIFSYTDASPSATGEGGRDA